MTLNHNEALARVTVDGLGICCFNSELSMWDIAFLRLPDTTCHRLLLSVEGEDLIELDRSVRSVSFETVNGHFPSGFPDGFFDNGPINRRMPPTTAAERENFRWVIDLEDDNDVPHGFIGLKDPPETGLTRAFIHNAVFYTLDVSAQDLILVHDNVDPNPPMPSPPRLGRTNDEIAADIFCNPGGELVIKINEEEVFPRKPQRPGDPWKICLTNLCIEGPPHGRPFRKGDFQNFYKVIDISGPRHALWGDPRIYGMAQCYPGALVAGGRKAVADSDFLVGRPDCDTTRLGTVQTLDPLFS
jgi:hypothetical protein